MTEHRTPYVGEGADGARRSAQIDQEELDTLPDFLDGEAYTDAVAQRRAALANSRHRWLEQARDLELEGIR